MIDTEIYDQSGNERPFREVSKRSRHPRVTPHTQKAALMRLSVTSLRRMIKGNLRVRPPGVDVVQRSGVAATVPATARCAAPAARGVYDHRRGLRPRPAPPPLPSPS